MKEYFYFRHTTDGWMKPMDSVIARDEEHATEQIKLIFPDTLRIEFEGSRELKETKQAYNPATQEPLMNGKKWEG